MIEPVLTEISQSVLAKRYLIRNASQEVIETPKALFQRVADFLATAEAPGEREKWAAIFYRMMAAREFEPNTPCLVNAGRPDGTGQLSACFVLPVPDSMDGIFGAIRNMALVQKTGGGTGFSFSRLRPEGDFVSTTSGVASGPISFMEVFDFATERIKQGGVRRGANMGILRIDHPDIMKFIALKQGDANKMQNFNVSVAITDAFMLALEAGKDFDLIHPVSGNVVAQLHAPTVWKEIVRCAHKIGDPGLWFVDRVNATDALSEALGPIEAPNPCQPVWATVLTPDGIRTLADIDVGSTIWSGQRWTKVIKKVATGVKPVHAYRTRAGTFYGTENHRVMQNGRKIEARAADAIDAVVGVVDPRTNWGYGLQDVVDGLVLGDGTYHKASGRVFLCAGPDEIEEYRCDPVGAMEYVGEHRPGVKDTAYEVRTTFKTLPLTYNRTIPNEYRYGNTITVAGFLRGLYSANGSVTGNRVTLKASSFAVIEAVQEMLSSIGISSYYTVNKAHDVEHANGVYTSRESYDLNIGHVNGRRLFAERIGFIQAHKNERLTASLDANPVQAPKITYDIADIEYIGDQLVFDITVDADEHTYWTGGLLVSNCGEVGLRPFDACCLGSVNLAEFFVEKEAAGNAHKYGNVVMRHGSIDFDRLQRTVQHSVRFLDNMLTVNKYPIPEIHDVTSKCRKIGLGVMGWADLLVQLGIPYSAPEARELGTHVMKLVNTWAADASEKLAEARGPFHHWPVSKWAKLGHKPRRHATTTVIAPTGTISIIAGCSSGIEPLYGLSMTRDQAGMTMLEVNPLVEKIAKREGFWSDQLAETVRQTGSLVDAPGVPDHWRAVFAIANELSMEDHVGMQSVFQAHTEDAVSKTINLKNDATEADIERAYMLAWTKGCKGITVYRDGCRSGQVLTTGVAAKPADVPVAPAASIASTTKRRVPADGRRSGVTLSRSTPYGSVHMTINHHPSDGNPFELFVRVGKSGSEVMAWAEAFGRVVSYTLALPSPFTPQARLEEVARQLSNIGGGDVWAVGMERVVSAPDAIAKMLLSHLGISENFNYAADAPAHAPAHTPMVAVDAISSAVSTVSAASNGHVRPKSKSLSDLCPACGKAAFIYQQRCGLCTNCGHSKC
jgi:ribonucleoside-diphosphate reductase alpha chain